MTPPSAEPTTEVPGRYACQQCGRQDGLDAVVTDEIWAQLTGRTDGGGLLCLWCMDTLAVEKGITAFVMLHFAGRSLTGGDGPTVWDESKLTKQILEAKTRCVNATARVEALEAGRCGWTLDGMPCLMEEGHPGSHCEVPGLLLNEAQKVRRKLEAENERLRRPCYCCREGGCSDGCRCEVPD